MKFKAPWFMDGKEVDLPDMKVEGTLAVAELTKQNADEFIPFITTIQEEAILRVRVAELSRFLLSGKKATDDQIDAVKIVCRFYKIEPSEKKDELLKQCNELFVELNDELMKFQRTMARNSVISSPFFLKRSLHEAYYMIKAYIWDKARTKSERPEMPFTIEDLKTLIDDEELAIFAKHSIDKIRKNASEAVGESPETKTQTAEEIKKK